MIIFWTVAVVVMLDFLTYINQTQGKQQIQGIVPLGSERSSFAVYQNPSASRRDPPTGQQHSQLNSLSDMMNAETNTD